MMATTGSNDYLQWHVYICTSCAGLVAAAAATTGGQILGSASLPASKIVPEIAIEYSLGRWAALVRYLDDGDLPIDNNHVENRIRPVALGRYKCIFAGS